MKKPDKEVHKSFFSGTIEEYCSCIPEDAVDDVIILLGLNPDSKITYPYDTNLKNALWRDLASTIRFYGDPSPTDLNANPTKLAKHASDLNKKLSAALSALKSMEYESVYRMGTLSKDFIVADRVRVQSIKAGEPGVPRTFFGTDVAQGHFEQFGSWPENCPFDRELKHAIEAISRIAPYFAEVEKSIKKEMKGLGKNKQGKDNSDAVFLNLCRTYKSYTGNLPISWNTGTSAINAGQFTGDIIPFLQKLLPYSFYAGELTPAPLQKKIMRMSKSKKYPDLWPLGNTDTKI